MAEAQKADLGELIKVAQDAGAIKVVNVAGRGQLVEIPDGKEFDYGWIGGCGHVSGFYTTLTDALRWKCDVCLEEHSQRIDVRDLVSRLEAAAWPTR